MTTFEMSHDITLVICWVLFGIAMFKIAQNLWIKFKAYLEVSKKYRKEKGDKKTKK